MSEIEDAVARVKLLIQEFEDNFEKRTEDPENFLTITELEELWGKLRTDTNLLYSDLLCAKVKSIDEKQLIRKKKRYSKSKGSSSSLTEEPKGQS